MGGLLFLKNDKLNVQPIEVPIQPASQVKSAEKAPPKTEGIKITVTGMPDGSTIYYDKMPVPVNPFRVKPRNTIVPIKVEADGYEPFITSVVPSKDIGVEVKLVLLKDTENDSEKDNDDNEKLTQKRRHKKQGVIKKKKKNGAETKSASGSKNTKGFKKGGRETLFSEDFEWTANWERDVFHPIILCYLAIYPLKMKNTPLGS